MSIFRYQWRKWELHGFQRKHWEFFCNEIVSVFVAYMNTRIHMFLNSDIFPMIYYWSSCLITVELVYPSFKSHCKIILYFPFFLFWEYCIESHLFILSQRNVKIWYSSSFYHKLSIEMRKENISQKYIGFFESIMDTQNTIYCVSMRNTCFSEFFHESILKSSIHSFHPSFSLRRIRKDESNTKFLTYSSKLCF